MATTGLAQSHWEQKSSNASGSLNAVVFGNGLFVAVGENGTIVTSPDGESWTAQVSGTTDRLPAIAFGNGRFVATRVNRHIPAISSLDGISWGPVLVTDAAGARVECGAWDGIAFGGGRFMAVGSVDSSNSEVMGSADGITFQQVIPARYPAPFPLSAKPKSLLFLRGEFFGAARYDGIYSTSDGIQWKARAEWGGTYGTSPAAIATDGIRKVTVIGHPNFSQFSVDAGHTFKHVDSLRDYYPVPGAGAGLVPTMKAMCYSPRGLVGVDGQGRVWTSERGEYWLPRARFVNAGGGFSGVAFDGVGRFVAVGSAPASGQALIAASSSDAPPPAPPGYTVYSLRALTNGVFNGEPRAISNSGIIGGSIINSAKQSTGAILRDGVVTAYPDPVYKGYPTVVTDVNDGGAAALNINLSRSFALGIALPAESRTFPGASYSTAQSINAGGSIAGTYYNSDSTQRGIYRYESSTGAVTDLGDFGLKQIKATSLNDSGDIVGTYFRGADPRTNAAEFLPFQLLANGELSPIPTLGGTFVYDVFINSARVIAGSSSMPSAPNTVNETHAFLAKNGVASDIDLFNSSLSIATAMNNNGHVVGEFQPANPGPLQSSGGNAFLYRDGMMYDLNSLLDGSGDGWVLYRPTSINDDGWIVGEGWIHGDTLEPFLAIPAAGGPAPVPTRFVNVSTRLRTGAGDDALIAGFILRGGAKRVILRAIGPGLKYRGDLNSSLPDLLPDPTLELFNDRGERIAFNDNYTDLPQFPDKNTIARYGLSPPSGGSVIADSVIMATLPEGSYTAVVRGKGGMSGNCLVEVYNVDVDHSPGLLNISTRGPVGTGDNVMIAGVIVRGENDRRILVRAIGPGLAAAGVANPLADPTLEVHDQNGQIAANDDWRSDQETEVAAAGLAPGDDRDAALIVSLWPGTYTTIVRGKDNSTGNALVEVYALPD
ncbi:MAG TPA: DUF3466 family protein [Chthoniobacterales bacterium]|nr:DUF3466 family protein [Chthoniobacterales bacterium]